MPTKGDACTEPGYAHRPVNVRAVIGLTLAAGLALVPSSSAWAQAEDTATVKGIAVVVELKGRRKHGADRLSRTLRRTLADALGGLRSSRALHREQDRLQMPAKERTRPSSLAIAGRGVAADYLVFVRVARKKRANYEAKGYLIDTKDGQVVHRHIVKYARPSKEAGKAGKEIAESMLAGLKELAPTAPKPASLPIAADIPEPVIGNPATPKPAPAVPVVDEPNTVEPPAVATAPTNEPAVGPALAVEPAPAIVTPAPSPSSKSVDLRLGVGIGAGLVRSYSVSAEGVGASDLSHSVSPQGMARVAVELKVPSVGLGFSVQGAWRPVGYTVVVDGQTEELSGLLIDARTRLRYHIAMAERAGGQVELIPALGLRVGRSGVETHTTNVIPSATLMVVFAELGARLPYDENLEFEASVELGAIAGYNESPAVTGEAPGGFAFGADFGLHYWMSDSMGIALDTRFTLDRLSFAERPTRAVTLNEQFGLQNANVSITDVRTAASVVFRF